MKNKRGFTIVELVIVIAVVAVLSAVMIPTFAGIVKKANISADTQAVRNMNVILMAESVNTVPTSAAEVKALLERNGITVFITKTASYGYYWLKNENTIVLADESKIAVYPENFKNTSYSEGNWFDLAGDHSAETPNPDSSENIGLTGDSVGFVLTVNSECEHNDIIPIIPQSIKVGDKVDIILKFPEEMKLNHKFYDAKLTMTDGDSISGLVAISPTTLTDTFELGEPVTFDIEEVTGNITIILNIKVANLQGEKENELGGNNYGQ